MSGGRAVVAAAAAAGDNATADEGDDDVFYTLDRTAHSTMSSKTLDRYGFIHSPDSPDSVL